MNISSATLSGLFNVTTTLPPVSILVNNVNTPLTPVWNDFGPHLPHEYPSYLYFKNEIPNFNKSKNSRPLFPVNTKIYLPSPSVADYAHANQNKHVPPIPTWPAIIHYGYPPETMIPAPIERYDYPHAYGKEYGRAHLQMSGGHSDTSVNWHSLLQLMLLAILATGGTIGNIFMISGLTIIEHFQTSGNIYLVSVALANLLITVVAVPCSCIEIMAVSPNHPDLCAVQWFLTQLVTIVTLISFALISIENVFSLSCPASACNRFLCSKMRIIVMLLLVWSCAIMLPWLRQLYHLTPDLCVPFVHPPSANDSSTALAHNSTLVLSPVNSSDSSNGRHSKQIKQIKQMSTNHSSVNSATFSAVEQALSRSSSVDSSIDADAALTSGPQLGIVWPRFHLIAFICFLCIPPFVSFICFTHCALRIKRVRQRLRSLVNTNVYIYPNVMGDLSLIKANIVVNAYASISWSPLIVCTFLATFAQFSDTNYISIAWWFAWTFSCVYSFVYAIINRDFGEAFFKLFFYCCCKSHMTFIRKSFTYGRPSMSTSLSTIRRRTNLGRGGESFGLRVHIIPGLNMSQRREAFSLIGSGHGSGSGMGAGTNSGSGGGGGGGIGAGGGSGLGGHGSSGHGYHSGILRNESFGNGSKMYGQTLNPNSSHHHSSWTNSHKNYSNRTMYEKDGDISMGNYRTTSRGDFDNSYGTSKHSVSFGRNFRTGNMSTAKYSSFRYGNDL